MDITSDSNSVIAENALTLTEDDLNRFLEEKQAGGLKSTAAARYRSYLRHLMAWLPEDKIITKELLLQWRAELESYGYGKATVEKYVTCANLYTKHCGHPEYNIKNTRAYDLRGKQFGYLTAIEPTEKRTRKDIIWLCKCKCGKEIEVAAGLLARGNTTSCGCLNADILSYRNRYVDGTELRQSMADNPFSTKASSGYTGVTKYKDKWHAYITYKKKVYHLGYYTKLEDAVKARARAKEEVMADAMRLYEETDYLYDVKPGRPPKPAKIEKSPSRDNAVKPLPCNRYDNTSGCTGVTVNKGKWCASIAVRGVRYNLGRYEDMGEAIRVRKQAEAYLLSGEIDKIEAMSYSKTGY